MKFLHPLIERNGVLSDAKIPFDRYAYMKNERLSVHLSLYLVLEQIFDLICNLLSIFIQ